MKTTPLVQVLGAALLAAISTFAAAQAYPSRPVTCRCRSPRAAHRHHRAHHRRAHGARRSGQTLVVENTAGAGGTIAGNPIAHAAPDGIPIAIGHVGTHVIAGAVQKTTYDVFDDFEPIGDDRRQPADHRHEDRTSREGPEGAHRWTKATGQGVVRNGRARHAVALMAVYYNKETGSNLQNQSTTRVAVRRSRTSLAGTST
jgi:hypothetical protein